MGLDKIRALASLPSREELVAQFVYLVSSPLRQLVGVLAAPHRDLVSVLSRIKK